MNQLKKVPVSTKERQAKRQTNLRQALHLSQVMQRDTRSAVYMIKSSLDCIDDLKTDETIKVALDMQVKLIRSALKLLVYDAEAINQHRRSTDTDV